MVKAFQKILILLIAFLPGTLLAADFEAIVDRVVIGPGDEITLTLEYSGKSNGEQPDITPVEQVFEILSQRQSSSTTILNGDVNHSYKWVYVIAPKATGTVIVPPIYLGNEHTDPITITVKKSARPTSAKDAPLMFAEAVIDNPEPYVQEQVTVTVKLYERANVSKLSLVPPELKGAYIEGLEPPKDKTTEINGYNYKVIERKYAILPQTSGNFTIPPVLFIGYVQEKTRHKQRFPSMFDDMFGMPSPFNDSGFFDAFSTKEVRTRSNPIEINVKPKPAQTAGNWWLPAKNIEIFSAWKPNPPVFRKGEAVTRIVGIQATGLMSEQIPDIEQPETGALKIYPGDGNEENNIDKENITGLKQQSFVIIPQTTGKVTLPAIDIEWWDTTEKQFKTASIPEQTIEIEPPLGMSDTPPVTEQTVTPTDDTSVNEEKTDIQPQEKTPEQTSEKKQEMDIWIVISGLLALCLAVTVTLLLNRDKKQPEEKPKENKKNNLGNLEKEIEKACGQNLAKEAKNALMEWGKEKWKKEPPTNASAIAKKIGSAELEKAIEDMNRYLYTKDKAIWDGSGFFEIFSKAIKISKEKKTEEKESLPSLYAK